MEQQYMNNILESIPAPLCFFMFSNRVVGDVLTVLKTSISERLYAFTVHRQGIYWVVEVNSAFTFPDNTLFVQLFCNNHASFLPIPAQCSLMRFLDR